MCRDPVADRMVNGEVLEFSALPFDTVRRLKAKLAAQTGVPAHQQRLLLNTEILRDRMGEICVIQVSRANLWKAGRGGVGRRFVSRFHFLGKKKGIPIKTPLVYKIYDMITLGFQPPLKQWVLIQPPLLT